MLTVWMSNWPLSSIQIKFFYVLKGKLQKLYRILEKTFSHEVAFATFENLHETFLLSYNKSALA
jgi:hypothetical protein